MQGLIYIHSEIKKWFSEKEIQLIEWPSQSPDANPIEDLWSFLKRKVTKYAPQNKSELKNVIKRVWENEIPQDLIQNLALSFKKRIIDLINSKGGHIDY